MGGLPNCVAIDTETTGLNPWRGHRMFAASATFPDGRSLFFRDDFTKLKEIVEDPTLDKVFFNEKFDCRMSRFSGMEVRGTCWDVAIHAHLLDGRDANRISLDYCSQKYLPTQFRKLTGEIEQWFEEHGVAKVRGKYVGNFADLPNEILRRRVCGDGDLTMRLFQRMHSTVASTFPFLLAQEQKLVPVVLEMEDRGICVDQEEIAKQEVYFDAMVEECVEFLEGVIGEDYFNLDSPAHQRAALEAAGIYDRITERTEPSKKFPNGQPKMDDYNLRNLHHPVAHMLLVGKAAKKMRSTFLGQAGSLNVDGVLHPNFNPLGTISGRFSCSGPNLQNIPIEGDRRTAYTEDEANEAFEMTGISYAPHLKRIFIVRPGYAHIHSDKKQAEMVMLAHYAKSKDMMEIFATGKSIHDGICQLLYGEWTKGLKTRTKAVVFGYQYGASNGTLAKKIGGTIVEAIRTRRRLAQILPDLPRWQRELAEQINDRGYCLTDHGRRHYLKEGDEYMAVNRMCQGSVGDEIKSRMIAINDWLRKECIDGRVLLNIHDDICTEVEESAVPYAVPNINRIMHETSIPYRLALPSSLDISYTRWSDLVEIEHPDDPSTFTREVITRKAV